MHFEDSIETPVCILLLRAHSRVVETPSAGAATSRSTVTFRETPGHHMPQTPFRPTTVRARLVRMRLTPYLTSEITPKFAVSISHVDLIGAT
jgi:hypothetical protein